MASERWDLQSCKGMASPSEAGGTVASWVWQVSGSRAGLSACAAGNAFYKESEDRIGIKKQKTTSPLALPKKGNVTWELVGWGF